MRRLALLAAAVVTALAAPAAALAHATLVEESPGLRERLASPPAQVVLTYDQPVDAVRDALRHSRRRLELADVWRLMQAPIDEDGLLRGVTFLKAAFYQAAGP